MSGVPVPKLGSTQDAILRGFLSAQADKRIKQTKLSTIFSLSQTGGNKNLENALTVEWGKYVEAELGIQSESKEKETDMRKEYEELQNLRPVIKKTEKGFVVEGI